MMKLQTVQQIMHKHPITVQCQTPLTQIIATLIETQQSQLPVINKSNTLIGMVSLIDCQKALLNSAYHCDQPVNVNDVMTKDFINLTADEALSEVAIKTLTRTENVFLVLQEEKLIGILKRVDLLVELNNNLALCTPAR
ncbi:CBS domain-containing protein [Psychromonas sp. Urea-02u-13]|uniref:CBS domain-containing protein n=1 Tax=Psychromonas sp. Urea-02u-13 TaxID=2058326 RepID=UPI000C32E985|nr:CBS domain-containing protein [Psychromonas sp. Urea-02u-13]PKG38234.1 hypothetical protein CXF74_14860 [Psychromonas sp. Urea-02u-13]